MFPTNEDGTPGPQLPGAANEETLISMRFAVEARTNCIVAAGSPGDLKTIEALLFTLDREDQQTRKQNVYFLKNMKADPVAATLNEYIRSKREIRLAAAGVISNYQGLESEVIVIADTASNSLIIDATPKYYDEIIDLIREIDKSPPQVVINVLIAEITLSDTDEWGAELGLQDPLLFARGGSLFFNNPTTPLGGDGVRAGLVGSQFLTNFGTGNVGSDTGFGGVTFRASSQYVDFMLRTLREKKRVEILSNPQIMTMNNQQAVVSTGQKVPRYNGVSYSYGSAVPIVEDVDVSLMLTVRPTISPEGTIVMGVSVQKEKVGSEADGILITKDGNSEIRSPKIDNVNVATMISAANNETVILGGLITRDDNKICRKVPLLGDVPYLGKMFRYEFTQTVRKELLVILTPRIVQSPSDMEQIKQMEFARRSWCMKNVVQVYGDLGAYNVVSEQPYTGNAPVITPEPVKKKDLIPLEPPLPPIPTPILPKKD
jgi:type II secretion system protein D